MPEKPELTLEEKMNQSADDFVANMDNALADKSTAPPELEALRDARKANASPKEITIKVYELMIERAMRYDEDPDTGSLTPTGFDIPNNLEVAGK
jgi:nucleoid-associated protein YejK